MPNSLLELLTAFIKANCSFNFDKSSVISDNRKIADKYTVKNMSTDVCIVMYDYLDLGYELQLYDCFCNGEFFYTDKLENAIKYIHKHSE